MKTLERIELDLEFQILDERQRKILRESLDAGVDRSQYVKEWNANITRMSELKKQGCKYE